MEFQDAGLATNFWHVYFSDDEIEQINRSTTTMFMSGRYPIHVRMYLHDRPAPTVIMGSPMLLYGLLLAPLQLRMFNAGFNVIQWDLPGWGQSAGARSGCPAQEIVDTWRVAIDFATERFDPPYFVMGLAEDGVTAYYACANHPKVTALSVHNLFEYGDPEAVHWHGPVWYQKVKEVVSRFAAVTRPELGMDSHQILPWETIFPSEVARDFWQRFEADPLLTPGFQFSLVATLIKASAPPVPFEECRTPVQVIASENSDLWLYQMNVRYFNRLGGPKELATLAGQTQWDVSREFYDEYADNAARWFKSYLDDQPAPVVGSRNPAQVRDAGLADGFWRDYYDSGEVGEILEHASTTMIASGRLPVHIRQFVHDLSSPTVILSNALPGYGLSQARLQLPFFRAGFNVVQFDAPGSGQSGGPRGGCRVTDFVRAWDNVVTFARRRFGEPLYGVGIGEDGLHCYMSQANRGNLAAITVNSLMMPAQRARMISESAPTPTAFGPVVLLAGAAIRPTTTLDWHSGLDVTDGSTSGNDPLVLDRLEIGMAASLGNRRHHALPLEYANTPIQVVVAHDGAGAVGDVSRRNAARLGNGRLATIEHTLAWPYERAAAEAFCAHAIDWFRQHGAAASQAGR